MAAFAPMLLTTGAGWPAGGDWILEPKWDGFRLIAATAGGRPRAWTRHGTELTAAILAVLGELAELVPADSVLDGELVALAVGADGEVGQDFARLGATVFGGQAHALCFVVFDALQLAGRVLIDRPWHERRAELEAALSGGGRHVRLVHVFAASPVVHAQLLELGFEGSVLKRRMAPYRPGRRSSAWRKVKTRSQASAVLEVVRPDRASGVVERVGCRVQSDPARVTWATVWNGELRCRLTAELHGAVGRPVRVTYTHRTVTGQLREARVTELVTVGR